MKKAIFTLLILFVGIYGFSQKCKYDFDQTDSFNGTSTKGFDRTISRVWTMRLSKTNDDYAIGLLLALPGTTEYLINKGDSCLFVLENGEKIVMFAQEDAIPNSNVVGQGSSTEVLTFYYPYYSTTEEQMKKLGGSPIKAMRIYFQTLPVTLDVIPKKNGKKIVEAAKCLVL